MKNDLQISPSVNNSAIHRRRFYWVWHRRLGLISLVLIAILCITGILLNHTEALRLDEKPLRNSLLLKRYGIKAPEISSFAIGQTRLSQLSETLYANEKYLLSCNGQLVGVALQNSLIAAACSNEIILLTEQFELIERIDKNLALPTPITRLGLCENQLCITTTGKILAIDLDQLQWSPLSESVTQKWSIQTPLPKQLRSALLNDYLGNDITWERVILDLHSGRILGTAGVVIMDLAAITLLILGLSGFWLWWSGPGHRRKPLQK